MIEKVRSTAIVPLFVGWDLQGWSALGWGAI
jgi:hypothetical protein